MAITQASFLADPDARRIFLADITMRRRYVASAWTHDGTYTNCWRVTWPHQHILPASVQEYNVSYTSLTVRASVTLCNSNDASWFYDETTSILWINPTGSPSPLTFRYLVTYPLRVATEDVTATLASRAVQYYGALYSEMVIDRSVSFLDGVATAGAGRLRIKGDEDFELADRYENELFIGAPVTLWVGGYDHLGRSLVHTGSDSGAASTSYAIIWTGYLSSGPNAYGEVDYNPLDDDLSLPLSDAMTLYSVTIPYSANGIHGRPDEIINSALTTAGLTTATIETNVADDLSVGVAAAVPYHSSLLVPEETSVLDIIKACAVQLLIFYVDRVGVPRITYWKLPAAEGDEALIINSDQDPVSYTRKTDYSRWFTAVTALLGRGRDGAARAKRANLERRDVGGAAPGDDRERIKETFTSGWTQRGSFNVWDRAYSKKPVAVVEGGVDYAGPGDFNRVDTDNLSWGFVCKDDVASGDPNRLIINPPSDPNSLSVDVWYERQQMRTTESKTSAKDVNVATASKAEASVTVGKGKPYMIHSLITNKSDAEDFVAAMLALVQTPLDVAVIDTTIANVQALELNDTIRLEDDDGVGANYRIAKLHEDWANARLTISAWRPHAGSIW